MNSSDRIDGGIVRGFEISLFRDRLGDLAVREMKTDHDKTNVRKYELNRSRANSGELFNDEKMANGRRKPMNYEEWSKSRELARTF